MTNLSKLLRASVAVLALTAASAAHAQTNVPLIESGSSLLYPLFNLWVAAYSASHPGADITTTSTGSGAGIAQAIKGLVQIGASDAYLSDTMAAKHPNMLNIPLAISSQAVNYNLPGVSHLNLSGPILAGIYEGTITQWNDPAIAAANPGVALPNHVIVPIHRLDGSGDTFIFTQYLAASDAGWASKLRYGTAVSWPPISGEIGAKGNQGMVTALTSQPYGVAYIGISFAAQVADAHLGQAALKDQHGEFVLPTAQNIANAANAFANTTPTDERLSMIFAPGPNVYPIVNYEYAVVNSSQPSPDVAQAVHDFLAWCLTDGASATYLGKVHFLPLPAAVQALSETQLKKIH